MENNDKLVVLAIDDDNIILTSVRSCLSSEYKVVPFTSGEKALKFLEKNSADLILLDSHMPGMSGVEMLAELMDNPRTKSIPVIFLTGAVDSDDEVAALVMGASDYIIKPIRPQVLLLRVQMHLELSQQHKFLEKAVEEKTNILRQREDVTLSMLARVTDLRDEDTGGHILRTTEYARVMVDDLLTLPRPRYFLSSSEAQDIVRSMKLHDLGKIAIPDKILLKPGKLTDEEFEVMKQHTVYGEHLFGEFAEHLGDDGFLSMARQITYGHHEKWNGKGYPRGLAGFEIPLSARIAAISDVYDALTTERPYKKPFPHEKAYAIITGDSGSHFDPYLVDVFKRHSEEFEYIAFNLK